jgi:hypothetical protein
MQGHPIRATFVLAAVLAALVLSTAPAAAKTDVFSDSFDSTVTDTSCGFPVEVRDVGKVMGRLFFDAAGNFVKIELTNAGVRTLTNPATGLSATQDLQILFKNTNQVDLGGGLLALDQTTVGAFTLRGPDGSVLLRGHGPVSAHLVINPEAESEEDFLVSEDVFFTHGSHPDDATYCQALTAAIGPGATP